MTDRFDEKPAASIISLDIQMGCRCSFADKFPGWYLSVIDCRLRKTPRGFSQ